MREVERTVIPKFADVLEQWEPRDGRLPFNFTGGTGERTLLGTYLHQGKYLSAQPNNLRTIINAFCMLRNCMKKQELVSSNLWEDLMDTIANSEFLAPDVRAVLLNDPQSSIRWKFYRILVDSFIQNTLKTLRTTINTARGEWQEFYEAVESGSNQFPGYAMPRAIPRKYCLERCSAFTNQFFRAYLHNHSVRLLGSRSRQHYVQVQAFGVTQPRLGPQEPFRCSCRYSVRLELPRVCYSRPCRRVSFKGA